MATILNKISALQEPNYRLAFDARFANAATPRGTVAEFVSIAGAPPAKSYKVRLLREVDSVYVAQTMSTPGTGAFSFTELPFDTEYVPLVVDEAGVYKARASGPIAAI